jgi:hypothetical protein
MSFIDDLMIPAAHGVARFGDVMADFQRERFMSLIPALQAIAEDRKPPIGRYWWEATKGASKDSDLAIALIWLVMFSKRPLDCQVGAGDRDQAGELRKAARDVLHENPWLKQRIEANNWQIINQSNATVCDIIAADVTGSHGARPDVLILNELSHVGKQEFAENLMDNAEKVPHGLVVIATNAGYIDTWQWKWRGIARSSIRWLCHIRDTPSPWLDDAAMEEARLRNSEARFKRLWYGRWAPGGEGDALNPRDIERAIRLDGPADHRDKDFTLWVGSIDLGVRADRSALTVVASRPYPRLHRLAYSESWHPKDYGGKVPLSLVEEAAIEAHDRFQLDAIVVDPSQAFLMMERLEKYGIRVVPFWATPDTHDLMCRTLLGTFYDNQVDLYDDPNVVGDLHALTIVDRRLGLKLEAPRDGAGHCDSGVSYAMNLTVSRQWCDEMLAGTSFHDEMSVVT